MATETIEAVLARVRGRSLDEAERSVVVESVAERLLEQSLAARGAGDRIQAWRLARMMEDPPGRLFTTALCDQAFRSQRAPRVADQLHYLVRRFGLPRYLGWWERLGLAIAAGLGRSWPQLVVPAVIGHLRSQTRRVIVSARPARLQNHLQRRRAQGVHLNLNQLGEAILGEAEAEHRLERYLALLARPDVDYVSVKISSITSLIDLCAFERTVADICKRLRRLYRAALPHGAAAASFVNLDMEEYRDLDMTVAAFTRVLDEDEFLGLSAGVVLQAYIPDSVAALEQLTTWAQARRARGGAPIKVRIVKGANLAMERVEAAQHGWTQAPYATKAEVDANYKRMLERACSAQRCDAVRIGVASHNLFDIAYGLVLRAERDVEASVIIEMLEGMANHQARAVRAAAGDLLLYLPVVDDAEFRAAIAYLVRRLDENTGPENFLRATFGMRPGSESWLRERERFRAAVQDRDRVAAQPRRDQDRRCPPLPPPASFVNAADTDFSLAANRAWLSAVLSEWLDYDQLELPLVVAGEERRGVGSEAGQDPSRPEQIWYRYAVAGSADVEAAITSALRAQVDWDATPIGERRERLLAAAQSLEAARGRLLGALVRDGGKHPGDADPEISEAIDFAAYYARSLDDPALHDGVLPRGRGVVVVAPPWNFPVSIPAGGCLAALMAGNAVILKPAPEAVLCAWELAQALWSAGIPRELLQFLPSRDDAVGRALISDPRIAAVILTGGSATARLFTGWRPALRCYAETGGKNSLVITGLSDRDQAIKDLLRSAFGHSGQKCSAASLAICTAEVYADPAFRATLCDAAASLPVGPAHDPWHRVTPLIRPPGPELERALTRLDPDESWLLAPRRLGPQLWTPGIRLGVQPGSFFHRTECFGPVLGLMRAENLDHAIELQNAVSYGLTGGLHSLDEREQRRWCERVEVGNAYVNRSITGAVVQRQPFGGWKDSCFGPGAKAGGPGYVPQLAQWEEQALPVMRAPVLPAQQAILEAARRVLGESRRLEAAAASQAAAWHQRYARSVDPSRVRGEANVLRYGPLPRIVLRVGPDGTAEDSLIVALALAVSGQRAEISVDPAAPATIARILGRAVVEDARHCMQRLDGVPSGTRLRCVGTLGPELELAAARCGIARIDDPVVANGVHELRHLLREQALSVAYHRYGNPGAGPPEWLGLERDAQTGDD